MAMTARRVPLLLFGSGFCALIYQTAWMREFRLVFGASTAASAAVLAIFIAGLGLGSAWLGPRADRRPAPLLFYAQLEGLIALSAALSPPLLDLVRAVYVALGGTSTLGALLGTLLRLLLAALVLGVPTFLMGGTLPAAVRAVTARDDAGRRSAALLYGVNTLGAVAGAFIGTFFMLELFGTRQTLWLACLANLLVALWARSLAREVDAPDDAQAAPDQAGDGAQAAPAWFVLLSAAVVGFAFFLMELVWYRMLGPILGGSIFTFGLILVVALLGIGLGGAAYALRRASAPATLGGFALTCLLEALLLALPFALGDRVALLALILRSFGNVALFWGHVLAWALVCALVVFPAAVVAGWQFPLLIALLGRGRAAIGRQVGLAYAWNTTGAIVGSLAGGFGLLPLLSATGVWRATGFLLVGLGLWAAVLALRAGGTRRFAALATLLLATALGLLAARGPTAVWRHSGIGAGRAPNLFASPNALEEWMRHQRRAVVWQRDGLESSVALASLGSGYAFVINGKIDGSARGDADVMIMTGLLGAALHEAPKRTLMIGLGTGASAGWLAAVPAVEREDVFELEPRVVDVARDCAPVNQGVLSNPKVRLTLGDAREALLVSRDVYDLVVSQPSNPYRAGIASLFTREYYEAVDKRLAPGGLFVQWVQAYEVDGRTLRTLYATLGHVFPYVETWQVSQGDLLLVAGREPRRIDADALRARLAREPFRSGLRAAWNLTDLEDFLGAFVARASFARAIVEHERGPRNGDDLNFVEFGFARTVGRRGLLSINDLREAAFRRGELDPEVVGQVDWERVRAARALFSVQEGLTAEWQALLAPSQRALLDALAGAAADEPARTARGFAELGREPVNHFERVARASAWADLGDARAPEAIAALAADAPLTAAALQVRLAAARGQAAWVVAAALPLLTQVRQDPWLEERQLVHVLQALRSAMAWQPAHAPAIAAALREPLPLRASDLARLNTLGEALSRFDSGRMCVDVLAALEPELPWSEGWLEERYECYRRNGLPTERAQAELRAFRSGEPAPFGRDLLPPPPASARPAAP